MKAVSTTGWTFLKQGYARLTGWLSILGGLLVLLGWWINRFSGSMHVRPLTALMFMLMGGALITFSHAGSFHRLKQVGYVLAGLAGLLSGAVLVEYALGLNLGIDLWLFRSAILNVEGPLGTFPGRPAPSVALSFLLLSAALLMLYRAAAWLIDTLVSLVLVIGTLILVGYFFEARALYQLGSYGLLSLFGALFILMLAIGVLSVAPRSGLFQAISSNLPGGVSARRLVPAAILTPLLLGWLDLQGELLNLYDERLGLAFYATATITILVGLVLINAWSLDRAAQHRTEMLAALREKDARYRTIVEQTPAIVYVDEIGGEWRYISPQIEPILGYKVDEFHADPSLWKQRIHPEDLQRLTEQVAESQATGDPLVSEFRFYHRDGRQVWLRDEAVVIREMTTGATLLRGVMFDITERKRSEEQLQYQAYLLDNVNDAIVASDENYILKAWNSAAERMYGWQAEEVLGRLGLNILHTEFSGSSAVAVRHRVAETGRYIGEAMQQRKDGRRIHVEVASIALKDQTGRLTGYVSVNRDITARKQAEQQFFLAVESAPNAIVLVGPTGRIVMVNPQTSRYFGYERVELLALNIDQLMPERFRRAHQGYQETFFENPQTRSMGAGRELYGLRKDGSEFPVEIGLTPIETATGPVVMVTVVDITERKRAESTLRLSESRYRNLVEQLPVVVYINPTSDVSSTTYVSPQIRALMGYSQAEWLEDPQFWSKRVHPDDIQQVQAMAARATQTGEPFEMEYRLLGRDGRILWIHDHATLLRDPMGAPLMWQGLMMDLTERKQAEQEREARLVLEAKNAELDRFAYTVSHDLRSPLVTILAYTKFLRKDLATERLDRAQNDLNSIEGAVTKMQALLTGVLTLARAGLTIKEPEQINFHELVEETLELLHGTLDASHAHTLVQPGLPMIWGDRIRLRQVIQNLVENAVKYCHPDRGLRIEIGIQGTDKNGDPILFVRDNGVGIRPEYHERIFELFGKVDGGSKETGVGLATVKRIVEVHGGRLWMESEAGIGSTFFFTLPSQPKLDSVL